MNEHLLFIIINHLKGIISALESALEVEKEKEFRDKKEKLKKINMDSMK